MHKILLGTNTADSEPNHLMIAKVRIPTEATLQDLSDKPEKEIASTSFAEKKLDIEIKMIHEGEVNKARYMPQKFNIIASMTNSGEIHIFDYMQHSQAKDENVAKPQLKLQFHTKEGFGLSWSSINEGKLITGAYDNGIALWDIQKGGSNNILKPESTFLSHEEPVGDVCFSRRIANTFASVGDDKFIKLFLFEILK